MIPNEFLLYPWGKQNRVLFSNATNNFLKVLHERKTVYNNYDKNSDYYNNVEVIIIRATVILCLKEGHIKAFI